MEGNRFSGCDWFSEKRDMYIIGSGGIGSWTIFNLARIGHNLYIFDGDNVDATNVNGGQLYMYSDIGSNKAITIHQVCRDFGCTNRIEAIGAHYNSDEGSTEVMICAVDNMKTRKESFERWVEDLEEYKWQDALYIDGRLLCESMEIFCIQGNNKEQIEEYRAKHLFKDEEVGELDCTTKQTTFAAMIIGGMITASLCNFLTNVKLGIEMREVPFYQRMHLPILQYKTEDVEQLIEV